MPIEWEGEGLNEVGKCRGKVVVKVNAKFYRPAEVETLLADYSKAKEKLGWEPKTKFKELVRMMIYEDVKKLSERGLLDSDKSSLDLNHPGNEHEENSKDRIF